MDFNKIQLLLECIRKNYEEGKDDGYLRSLSDLLERKKDGSAIFPPNRKYLQTIFERIEEILQRIEEKK